MGSMSHPSSMIPVPSSTELPLTRHSGDRRVRGHKLVDVVSPERARMRCSGGTLPQRSQIPPQHSSAAGATETFPPRPWVPAQH